jgi:hypothetical protein
MDKKFLNKVADHIVKETRIDFTKGRVYTFSFAFSFFPPSPFPLSLSSLFFFHSLFSEHCENVYGLNNGEMDYVWKEYKSIILDKING